MLRLNRGFIQGLNDKPRRSPKPESPSYLPTPQNDPSGPQIAKIAKIEEK